MSQEIINAEKNSNIMDLFEDVNYLSEQIQSIKEDLNLLYPLDSICKNINRIDRIENSIVCIAEKINGLEQYKNYVDCISKQNEVLGQKISKEKELNLQKSYSMKMGYLILAFIGLYSLLMFAFAVVVFFINNDLQIVKTLIIGGLSALLILTVIVIFFTCKIKDILIQNKGIDKYLN